MCEDLVDGSVIEVGAVVALEQERRPVAAEEPVEMGGDLFTVGEGSAEGFKLVARGQVTHRMDITTTTGKAGVVDGPDQIGVFPLDSVGPAFARIPVMGACGPHVGIDVAAGDGAAEGGMEGPGSVAAFAAVDQPAHLLSKAIHVERFELLRSRFFKDRQAPAGAFAPAPHRGIGQSEKTGQFTQTDRVALHDIGDPVQEGADQLFFLLVRSPFDL